MNRVYWVHKVAGSVPCLGFFDFDMQCNEPYLGVLLKWREQEGKGQDDWLIAEDDRFAECTGALYFEAFPESGGEEVCFTVAF